MRTPAQPLSFFCSERPSVAKKIQRHKLQSAPLG
jgi:hypothetical protein